MEIIEIKEEDERFQEFLENNKHSVFHTFGYKKFIEEGFGCRYRIFAVFEDKEIKLVLPVVEVKSRLLGNKVISTAYLEYGGFAGEERYVNELISFVNKKYGRDFKYLEIRGGSERFDGILGRKLVKKNLYKRFVLRLEDEETIWRNIQKSKRKAIKKALKNVEVKEVGLADLGKFYELYCRNMRAFGSPPYGRKYFLSFYRNIADRGWGKILGSYCQGKLVSVLLGFCYQEKVHIVIAVSDENFQEHRPNDAMHWEFIRWACRNNFKWFDFGRVREESGQFEYKRKWGPELKELPSYFLLWEMKKAPLVDPNRHGLLVKVWRKMPLWTTRLLGPGLRKGLGI